MVHGVALQFLYAAGAQQRRGRYRAHEIKFLIDLQNLYFGIISFDSEPDKIIVSQTAATPT